jgi:arylsulfatase
LATGLASRGNGVLQNGYELDLKIPNFMKALKENGWKTGAFGKCHFHAHFNTQFDKINGEYKEYGFDVANVTEDPRGGEWLDWIEKNYPKHYENALATVWTLEVPGLKKYGKNNINISERAKNIRKNFKWGTKKYPNSNAFMYTLPFPEHLSQTSWISKKAIDFIKESEKNIPIYAHISYVQPHSPSCPPENCMKYVDREKIPEPIQPEWVDDPRHPKCFKTTEGAHEKIPENWKDKRHYYFADVVNLDQQLGKIINALKETNRIDNTYIIFLSDHGELLLDHGFTGKGERHYDACIRVPLIISGPGLKKNKICKEIVQLEDLFPTIAELTGIPLPELNIIETTQDSTSFESKNNELKQFMETFPGSSLVPFCKGEKINNWRESTYIESFNNIESVTYANWARTIINKKWRYTMYPGGNGEQLFNIEDDPNEINNLIDNSNYAKIRQMLRDELLERVILQDYPHTPRSLFALCSH